MPFSRSRSRRFVYFVSEEKFYCLFLVHQLGKILPMMMMMMMMMIVMIAVKVGIAHPQDQNLAKNLQNQFIHRNIVQGKFLLSVYTWVYICRKRD